MGRAAQGSGVGAAQGSLSGGGSFIPGRGQGAGPAPPWRRGELRQQGRERGEQPRLATPEPPAQAAEQAEEPGAEGPHGQRATGDRCRSPHELDRVELLRRDRRDATLPLGIDRLPERRDQGARGGRPGAVEAGVSCRPSGARCYDVETMQRGWFGWLLVTGLSMGLAGCGGDDEGGGGDGSTGGDAVGGGGGTGGGASGGDGGGGAAGSFTSQGGASGGGSGGGAGEAGSGGSGGDTSICAPPAPFDVDAIYSTVLHVDPDGDDAGDGTETAPLATLEEALSRASAGTRVLMHAGTYVGSTWAEGLEGTASEPIAVVGEGEVVLDADGAAEVLHIAEARYLVLEHLTLENASVNGLNIDDGGSYDTPAEHVVLRDLTVRAVGTGGNNDCIKLSGVDRFFLLGSDISGCDAGDAVDMVGCHDGVIAANRIHDTPGSGGIQAKGGSSGTLVHGNRFEDVGGRSINAGGSTGLEFFRPLDAPFEAAALRVVANVFVRSGDTPIAFVGCDGCVFANNTIVDPQARVARILQETVDARFVPSRAGLFVNNVVVFQTSVVNNPDRFVNVGPDTAPETFVFGHNLWYATDDAGFAGPTLPDPIAPETGSVVADPGFLDPGAGDYRIPATSPAVGAGRQAENAPGDFTGRCWGEPPAIGAYEP